MSEPYTLQNFGWLVPKNDRVAHYYKGRVGIDVFVAACGHVAVRGDTRFPCRTDEVCVACDMLAEEPFELREGENG